MNKKLVAAALGLAFAAPVFADSSNVTLYGRIHQTLDHQSQEIQVPGQTIETGGNFVVEDASSRFGIRGQEDLGGGLSAIFAYEFGATTDEVSTAPLSTRHAYLGMKGSYGLFVIGSQDGGNDSQAPLYNQASLIGSVSNNGGPLTTVGGGGAILDEDATWAIQRQQRVGNSIGFATTIAGVAISARHSLQGDNDRFNNDFNAAGVPTAGNEKENGFRATEVTATYKVGALTVGGGIANFDSQENANPLGLDDPERTVQGVAAYNFGSFTLAGLVAQTSLEGTNGVNGEDSNTEYALSASVPLSSNSGLFGMYANAERNDVVGVDPFETSQYQVAYYYDFSKRTRTYVGYNVVENEVEAGATAGSSVERNNFTIGLRHNF